MSVGPAPRRRWVVATAALLVVTLAGCGSAASAPRSPDGRPPAPAAASSSLFLSRSEPTRVIIPTLDLNVRTIELGLRPDGTMEVPANGALAGWYSGAPTPGELGPAVITAHVRWKGERGAFADLKKLDPGDQIGVRRADGSTVLFEVLRVEQYAKDRFPTAEVYGRTRGPSLRLITCGGAFNRSSGHYVDNTIVFADPVGAR